LFISNPPGGSTDAAHVASFIASGHRPAVIVALYFGMLAVFGLIALLALLRNAMERVTSDVNMSRIFWGAGVVAAAAIAAGDIINQGPALAAATFTIAAPTIYLVVDVGAGLLLFAGGVMLAVALITVAVSSPSPLPAWLRWLTLALGVVALASHQSFFPSSPSSFGESSPVPGF
jgi:hypothetical protein